MRYLFRGIAAGVTFLAWASSTLAEPSHGLAMHGDLKYPASFTHFDYVNPDAPKGGTVKLSAQGGFDSFNGFIPKGRAAAGVGFIYDTLMANSADEPFSEYGLVAESVETPEDRSWVEFTLDPAARWHDGKPITPEDVIFSLEILKEKGDPFYRFYYGSVVAAEKTGERSVKFVFQNGENRELPLIMGQLQVLAKHYWEGRDFSATSLEPPLGSGPYRIKDFEPDRYVELERVEDYWAKDHPVRKGQYNFDTIRYEYFQDAVVSLEAFKAGLYDYRSENTAKNWATAYDFKAVREGLVKKVTFEHERTAGMQGFAFNMRRPQFQDPKVRQALAHAFDFEWSNETLFYDQYTRTRSFFDNSELAATGLPEGRELEILTALAAENEVAPEVFNEVYQPPTTADEGGLRGNLRKAVRLLKDAGWTVDKSTKKLTHVETGEVFAFEILLISPAFERIVLPFAKNLERLGIEATARVVDAAQYQQRVTNFDFDMIVMSWGQSQSPGNEQREFWTSAAADRPGSRNYTGLKDPAVDALVEKLIAAPDRESLVAHTRALDRLLQWHHIVIPNWHIAVDRVAYWNRFGKPDVTPPRGNVFLAWWLDPQKSADVDARKATVGE